MTTEYANDKNISRIRELKELKGITNTNYTNDKNISRIRELRER